MIVPTTLTLSIPRKTRRRSRLISRGRLFFSIGGLLLFPGCASRFAYLHPSVRWVYCADHESSLVLEHWAYLPGCVFLWVGTGGRVTDAFVENRRVHVTVRLTGCTCSGMILGPAEREVLLDVGTGGRAVWHGTGSHPSQTHESVTSITFEVDGNAVYAVQGEASDPRRTLILRFGHGASLSDKRTGRAVRGSTLDAQVLIVNEQWLVCVDGRKLDSPNNGFRGDSP
jgi:hypothetical protein